MSNSQATSTMESRTASCTIMYCVLLYFMTVEPLTKHLKIYTALHVTRDFIFYPLHLICLFQAFGQQRPRSKKRGKGGNKRGRFFFPRPRSSAARFFDRPYRTGYFVSSLRYILLPVVSRAT